MPCQRWPRGAVLAVLAIFVHMHDGRYREDVRGVLAGKPEAVVEERKAQAVDELMPLEALTWPYEPRQKARERG